MEKGYKVLKIDYEYNGDLASINPVVIFDSEEMVLVDCGYEGFMNLIEKAMEKEGLDPNKLTKIVLTHQDDDHMGAAYEFINKYPNIEIVASKEESKYISGEEKNLRLVQAENLQESLNDDQKEMGLWFINHLKNIKKVNVDIVVKDKDKFDWGNGCEIISTPGHTPGHISLYLNNENVIITGDAAVIENEELILANPQYTLDLEEAQKSLDKLINKNCKKYICYHGGVYSKE